MPNELCAAGGGGVEEALVSARRKAAPEGFTSDRLRLISAEVLRPGKGEVGALQTVK